MKKSELQENIDHLLFKVSSLMSEDEENKEPVAEDVETLHVFPVEGGLLILKDEEVNKPLIVESGLAAAQPSLRKSESLRFYLMWGAAFLLLAYIILGTLFSTYLSPTATITIIPDEYTFSQIQSFAIVDHFPTQDQLEGHPITRTLSRSMTTTASGKGHQIATYATGTITFYNGLLTPQSVPQDTLLHGSDGMDIITLESAYIPPANPPIEGFTSVPARAVSIGSSGNISARDVDEALGEGILALNLYAFWGGINARDFTFVSSPDIKSGMDALKLSLGKNVLPAFEAIVKGDEAITTPQCRVYTSSNHKVNDEALSVSVTLTLKCGAYFYKPGDLLRLAARFMDKFVSNRIGKNYFLSSEGISVSILSSNARAIHVSIDALWIYRIDRAKIERMVRGKSSTDALRILSREEGIEKASISGADGVPLDASHIHIIILEGNNM
jgi:hypothetical protein